jgi:predicted DNA-binding transcriptional regulator YafY
LREAVLERRSVWIGYVNAHGQESHRIIEPLEIDGGYVAAYDHRTDEVRTFAIHRITGLAEVPRS